MLLGRECLKKSSRQIQEGPFEEIASGKVCNSQVSFTYKWCHFKVPTAMHDFVIMHPWGTKKHQVFNATFFMQHSNSWSLCLFSLQDSHSHHPLKNKSLHRVLPKNTGNSARFIGFLSYKKIDPLPTLTTRCVTLPETNSSFTPEKSQFLLPQHLGGSAVSVVVTWTCGDHHQLNLFFQELWKSKMEKKTCNHLLPGNSLGDLFGDSESWPFEWRNRIPSKEGMKKKVTNWITWWRYPLVI